MLEIIKLVIIWGVGLHTAVYSVYLIVTRGLIMDYNEAMKTRVTRTEAEREIKNHDALFNDFVLEYGDKPEYKGADVLNWLGY